MALIGFEDVGATLATINLKKALNAVGVGRQQLADQCA